MERETAREILLRHSHSPRNGQLPEQCTNAKILENPLCGDHVELRLTLKAEKIISLGFSVKGCAICSASASLMCEVVSGRSAREVQDLSGAFEKALVGSEAEPWPEVLLSLESFSHLRVNPARRTCAMLPWIALRGCIS